MSFFLIFWATDGKFVNENDQLFPKRSNFVSILLCLSIYNETIKHLFSVIGAIKRNSLAVPMAEEILFRYCGSLRKDARNPSVKIQAQEI